MIQSATIETKFQTEIQNCNITIVGELSELNHEHQNRDMMTQSFRIKTGYLIKK